MTFRARREFRNGIEMVENYDHGANASGHPGKLKQVILNLLINAIQAMDRPGKIEVGCSPAGVQRVKIWIEDQGLGMSEEVMAHLYEPFFTTKDKGTGLGLATAYKIVEAHHGELRVTSHLGTGTRFEVYLSAAA